MTSNTAIDSSSEFNSLLDDWNRNQSGSENVSSITRFVQNVSSAIKTRVTVSVFAHLSIPELFREIGYRVVQVVDNL